MTLDWCPYVGKPYGLSNGVMSGAYTREVRCPRCGKGVQGRTNANGTFLGLPRHKVPQAAASKMGA